ncbi:MAG TPA: SdrD B-like domain-containing protein, partial [Pirellulales bacterium]|nr:SdrD B-like domain-containing protein [Pirellulales bacterium]
MFFRKPRKLRFDGRRALLPQIGQGAVDLSLEFLEERQLLTASAWPAELSDPADAGCTDPNQWSRIGLGIAADKMSSNVGGTSIAPSAAAAIDADAASLASASPSISIADTPTGSLSGYVFSETTAGLGNYTPDDSTVGEAPLAGVTVTLFDDDSETSETTITGLDGSYGFANLPAGDYSIAVSTPPGAEADADYVGSQDSGTTASNAIDNVDLAAGTNGTGNNFGEIVQSAALSGTVFVEPLAGSSDYNPSEPATGESPLPGVTVELSTADGAEVGTTTTDANGNYRFADLAPNAALPLELFSKEAGSNAIEPDATESAGYVLSVVPPDGYDADTAIPASGSTGTAGTGSISGILLEPHQSQSGDDFPLLLTDPGTVSGVVFSEQSAGSPDYDPSDPSAGESPLAGAAVTLFNSNGDV